MILCIEGQNRNTILTASSRSNILKALPAENLIQIQLHGQTTIFDKDLRKLITIIDMEGGN